MERNETERVCEAEPIGVAVLRALVRIEDHLLRAFQSTTAQPIRNNTIAAWANGSIACMDQPLGQFAPMASIHMVRIAPMIGSLCRNALIQAACELAADSADRFLGSGFPDAFAASRKWARRDAGMPIDFQLWTVETGASINRATAEVPPK